MNYFETYNHFKTIENYDDNLIEIDEKTLMHNFDFESQSRFILPGGCGNSGDYEYLPSIQHEYESDIIQQMLNKNDAEILENINFRYHIIAPKSAEKAKKIILMFHGFNEKNWTKYLPWAKYMVDKTGKSVVLFPIAFHMNRAPVAWSDIRQMYDISIQRKERHKDVLCSSLSNVAISTRLHNKPQRFIWSGLQTYYDIISFLDAVKANKHPIIDKEANVDIFSYSIGSFLAEILMMTNQSGYFSKSKFVSFCGGAVFNRLSPVSKFILDSEANVSLYSYIVEHLESHLKHDEVLRHYLSEIHPEGVNFRAMLDYKTLTKQREENLRNISSRIYAIALAEDTVVPAYEIINTLQGMKRDIPVKVDIFDFPYKYKHEDPFPALKNIQNEVDENFRKIFDLVIDFLEK
ncbi:MAG: DUF6051 family protein [Prevotellaceae bacterium]|jgi:uncharacterized protein YfbU (UPF0304 family)|nr:DUF6051 family protein [Prevotellaceae bacterium]